MDGGMEVDGDAEKVEVGRSHTVVAHLAGRMASADVASLSSMPTPPPSLEVSPCHQSFQEGLLLPFCPEICREVEFLRCILPRISASDLEAVFRLELSAIPQRFLDPD